jgi:tellurite resistance protein
MENEDRIRLLARAAQFGGPLRVARSSGVTISILSAAATSYGLRPSGDATVPTGFDPLAMALFEAIVEGAHLVATADDVFDASERRTFEHVVVEACGTGVVSAEQIEALVRELGTRLDADGLEHRVEAVAKGVSREEHAREVLRVAALLARANGDVSGPERDVLARIAKACGLGPKDVEKALSAAQEALGS